MDTASIRKEKEENMARVLLQSSATNEQAECLGHLLQSFGLEIQPITRLVGFEMLMPDDWGGDMRVRLTPEQREAILKFPGVSTIE